jgi:hypothetical protein
LKEEIDQIKSGPFFILNFPFIPKVLTVQSQSSPLAPSGNNGKDAAVGQSAVVSFGMADESGAPIAITNSPPIDVFITKPSAPPDFLFTRVNASQMYKPYDGNASDANLTNGMLIFLTIKLESNSTSPLPLPHFQRAYHLTYLS